MSSTPPPDPPRRPEGSPRPSADGAPPVRSGPPGDGWDDGRGGSSPRTPRRRGASSAARRSGPGGAAAGRATGGGGGGEGRKHLPRWLVPAMGGALVLIILLVVVFGGGKGGSKDAGPCLTDLMAHLPSDSRVAYGTDLVQARDAGYTDDGALEELGSSQQATGALPDALTAQYRFAQLLTTEAFTARTGVKPDQIECSLSDVQRSVLSGSFDVAEVEGSSVAESGNLAATEDLVAQTHGDSDPKKVLEERDGGGLAGNDDAKAALESLRDQGAYSVLVEVGNPNAEKRPRAAGLGVAEGEDDDRALVVAWSFADEDAAKAGRADVADRINAALQGTTSISTEDLTVDGSLVTAKLDTRKAPNLQAILSRAVALIPPD
ncbi:hypothetical protein KSP35_11760 [Aquihabitans sp. G128]|uniref:hypothetical protein n=1 Tax=Aquihabitans sp. G128 TaxID=2849779 RepID=UPI001C24F803|nr:hypothetical protein [Aquihabitans sp. G128]QXC59091.1 hypothetical protein KSP35_11760 [Aquihabitans sp. G128]